MCARFTVLSDTPIAAAIAGCVIPLSRNSTIWMRWRCAAGIFHRSAVFSRRTSAWLHLTICFPPNQMAQANHSLGTKNNSPSSLCRLKSSIQAVIEVVSVPAVGEPIDPDDVRVIDGDTIRVYQQQPDVRLVGFNAPETRRAACEEERLLGAKATRRLRDLVRAGNLDLEYVACSCPARTQGTSACNYGRDCGILKSHGRDVGAILIEEGLAVPFVCGATRCPRTPRPWCGS